MKVKEVLNRGRDILKENGIDCSSFDSRCILEYVLNLTDYQLIISMSDEVDYCDIESYLNLINKRASGYPLQYIIGIWDFMGLQFFVGEGVLIPRPETELLVEKAFDVLKNKCNPVVFDLCSGSGCIGISIANSYPDSNVYCVEKSSEAFDYLKRNIDFYSLKNVTPVLGDIFDSSLLSDVLPDVILSNPPYICSSELSLLQTEVTYEPKSALDGGDDGLDFYRVIYNLWFPRLNKTGSVILECGDAQCKSVVDIFSADNYQIIKDFNGIERIIFIGNGD